MMRTYRRYKEHRPARIRWFVVALAAMFLVVTALHSLGDARGPAFVRALARPLWLIEDMISNQLVGIADVFTSQTVLAEENRRLKSSVEALGLVLRSQSGLVEENRRLSALIEQRTSDSTVFVRVLASPPAVPYDELVLDAGTAEGLTIGDQVVGQGLVPLGEIRELSKHTSRAVLYSAPGKETTILLGTKRTRYSAYGRGGGRFEIIVPREAEVSVGDEVFLDGNPPLYYGTVSTVTTQETDFLQLVSFSSPINLFEIRHVGVISNAYGSSAREND